MTTALLAGVLAPWGGQATAQPPLAGAPAGSLSQSAAPGNGRAAAQSKLLQARVHLGGGDFDLADSLARDVESMRLSYAAGEDSPAKLREEIKKARTEPRALLQASRAALARKDFDLADRYATEADQRAGVFTFPAWGDTPTKALADIRAARKSSAPGKAVPSGTANGRETNAPRPAVVQTSHTTPVKDSKREEAKAKLSQARAQLAKGDHDQAEKLAREAAALSMTYASGEDSPNKVLQDVQKAKNDPRTLLQASRAALARRDYDQAERLAKQADDNAGLMTFAGFSDSPSKVLRDIQSARQVAQPALARKDFKAPVVKKDEKAVAAGPSAPAKDAKLDEARAKLAQARKQLARGDHGQAEKLAHEAAALCRTYPASDDNPAKVLQDVSKAKNDPQALLQASRAALARKDYDQAERLAKQADDNAGLMTFAGFGDSPSRALKDIQSARRAAAPALKKDDKTLVKEAKAPGLPAAAKAVAKDPKREEAKAKLSQARMQLAKGDHGQAEKLAREVASMSLSYTADQDSPAKVLQDVQKVRNDPRTLLQSSRAALARKDYDQAEKLAKQADDNAGLMTFAGFGDSPSKALKDIQSARKAAQPAATVKKDEKTIAPVVKKDEKAVAAGPSAPAKDAKLDEARAKLAQARKQLARGDHGQAEKLAHEAAALCRTYPASDDNPAKVLQDVSKAKNDPQALLQASRAALARKDYDQAERLAKQADDNAGLMTFAGFGDSPSRALKDIQSARRAAAPALKKDDKALVKNDGKTAPTTKAPANKIEPKMPVVKSDPRADAARATVKQGRAAFQAGKLDEAKKFSAQARDLKTNLGWWEDNPDRLDSDIRRAEGTQPRTDLAKASAPKVPGTSDLPRNKEAARTLLNRGRDELKAGKFEQAFATAQSVKAARDLSWGLFEDSPDRLLLDVEKARAKRDRDEADRLMADGRKLYEKGDYEGAARLAYRAQRLAGSYSIWDLGDRPSKLLADVQVAQARSRKTDLPPSALARKDEKKADTGVKTPPKPVTPPEGTRPENAIVKNTPPAAKAAPVTPPAKLQAQQLVAESQRLLRDGKLVEARQKAVEAQRLNVTFAADEITPDLVYQQIATEVRSRLDGLVREARGELDLKGDSAARFRNAEAKLTEAKQLAASFGQDTRPIDDRMAELRRLRDDSAKPAVPAATGLALTGGQTPIPAAPVQAQPSHGQQLLEKARLELRRGETKLARRMCEEVLTGNHGVRDEAVALLRTIDAEEFNQTRLAADRTFDAAASAYRRGEHAQAGTLISAIDTRLLSPDRQVRLREMALTPEMKAAPVGLARATDMKKPGAAVPPALAKDKPRTGDSMPGGTKLVAGGEVGKAVATDKGGDELDKLKARQKVLMDKLRSDALDAQKIAAEKARAGQHEAAVDVLQDYLAMLNEQQLEPGQLTLLKRPVEARVNQYRLLKSQRDLVEGNRTRVKNGMAEVQAGQRAEELKKKNVEKIMKDFNTLYKEGKYLEAESMALRAQELDPDNGLATAAVHMARRHRDVLNAKNLKEEKQKYFLNAMNDAERPGPAGVIDSGIAFDPAISERTRKRLPLEKIEARGRKGEAEKNIERRLSSPVRISFENAPLKRVLEDLSDYHGINIVPDLPAMQEAGVSLESPVSIKLDQVSLKSALNLILHQVKLTHVIKDEVLNITTEEHAKGKLMTVTYPVADLVLPVENFGDVRNSQLNLPGRDQPQPPALTPTPVTGTNSMIGGSSVGTPSGLPGTGAGTANGGTTVTKSAPVNTMQTQLIELITKTIRHQSWSDMGGPGTIDYHPLTMALVINQTPDIQEQIQDLLASLRRLQDQEVAVEVRFITVSEDFFERIGVNFNVNILTDSSNRKFEPSLLQNSFVTDPTNFINAFSPGRFLAGSTPAGTLTSTLDIPITNSSFFQTVPAFGNYVPGGGLALGLAFLSDIQVFLFLEAVQGDVRTNLMQAPKLTLFNGQTSTVGVGASQPMITGVQVAQLQGGQFAFIPQVAGVAVGGNVNLTVQAVISADRRFVRLSLTPTFTSLRPGPIAAIPVTFPIFTSIEGNQAGQPVVFTQYISSPVSTFVTISTTVAVPDGGTVLLGGLKQLSEERSEYGPPILSKIPYINRLFKNVGYGRSADSLLIMVTPRIIIQSEEEERATGFTLTPAIQQ